MSLILNIDTALETASVALCRQGETLSILLNKDQKDHAAWIHTAIQTLLHTTNTSIHNISAIALVGGPGSYTGLRVGMATAKGLCYALNIPLIVENTLRIMTYAATKQYKLSPSYTSALFCPMIDARRMEVFTALYDEQLYEILKPTALVLNEKSFTEYLYKNGIIFYGNGSKKFQEIIDSKYALFEEVSYDASDLGKLSYRAFLVNQFANLPYAEPIYLKEFYTPNSK